MTSDSASLSEPRPAVRTRRMGRVRAFFHATGYLVWVLLALGALSAWLHHVSRLPPGYPWDFPFRILRNVVQGEWFPTLALVALGFGIAARKKKAVGQGVLPRLRALFSAPSAARWRMGAGVLAGVAVAALGSSSYNVADYLAAGVLGGAVATVRRPRAALFRGARDLVIAMALFAACSYIFTVIKALLFTVAAFEDKAVIDFEVALFGAMPHRAAVLFASARPSLVVLLDDVYFRLFEHMALTSVFLVGASLRRERTRLWCALAVCYLIGGPAYYVFPAIGPRFFDSDTFDFMKSLPLISNRIQLALFAATRSVAEGHPGPLAPYGYLACVPSLHLAHELVLLYFARHSLPWFLASLVFTLMSALAVLVLGWHYSVDIAAGALLAAVSIGIVALSRDRLLPRAVFQRHCALGARTAR